jgi:DNA-directed RNA polymerase subunit RPC12/RpoP
MSRSKEKQPRLTQFEYTCPLCKKTVGVNQGSSEADEQGVATNTCPYCKGSWKEKACPKCGQVIEFIIAVTDERNMYNVYPDDTREHRDGIESNDAYFECPECYASLDITFLDDFFAGQEPARLHVEPAQLWLVRIEVRDGENEYDSEVFIRARDDNEANIKGAEIAQTFYEDEDGSYPIEPNESGWFEMTGDYRWVRCKRVTKVETLEDAIAILGGIWGK